MKKVETDKAILPGKSPHSQAIIAGNFIFTQGMIYLTTKGELLEGDIVEKTELIMKNLGNILEKGGYKFSDVVKATIYVTNMSYYSEINKVYANYFSDPFPARELICVKELPLGAEIEISLIGYKSN